MACRIKTFTLKTSSTVPHVIRSVIKLGDGDYFQKITDTKWMRITLLDWVRSIR